MEKVYQTMLRTDGRPITPLPPPPKKRSGDVFPVAGTCAGCRKDATLNSNLQQCGRCKLTRYVSSGVCGCVLDRSQAYHVMRQ